MRFFQKRSDSFQNETRQLLDCLPCECVVFSENKVMEEVRDSYQRAKLQGKSEGFIPVFIIPSKSLINELGNVPYHTGSFSQLQDGNKVVEKMCKHVLETKQFANKKILENNPGHKLLMEHEQFGKLNKEVIMAKVPVKHPWEVFSLFSVGVWDTNQAKVALIAIVKYWYELAGAVPRVLSYDEIELVGENVNNEIIICLRWKDSNL